MKHKAFLALCVSMLLCSFAFSAGAPSAKITSLADLNVTDELRAKHPLKPHHEKLSFTCLDCHEGQGNDASKFKSIGDKGCISCHGDKKKIAKRLEYMDLLKANPHNSVHDGPTLYCDECHNEHKKSTNMCTECHEHEVPQWMGVTP